MTSDPESPQDPPDSLDGRSATDRVVAAFGGIRPMANKLDTPVTTVQGWKKRGAIPQQRHAAIRAAADQRGIALDDATLAATAPQEGSAAPRQPAIQPPPVVEPPEPDQEARPTTIIAEEPPDNADAPQPEPPHESAPEEPAPDTTTDDSTESDRPEGPLPWGPEPAEPESEPEPAEAESEPEPAESEPDRPPPPVVGDRRSGAGAAWLAVFVALVSVGLVVTAPLWIDSAYRLVGLTVPTGTGPAIDPNRLNELDTRLSAMERQVAALEARTDPDAVAESLAAEIAAIEARVAAVEDIDPQDLDNRITAIRGAVDALAEDLARMDGVLGNQRIALTEARSIVTRLEARADSAEGSLETLAEIQGRDSRRIDRLIASDSATQALVLAIGQLRVAVDAGQPYQQPLAALRALANGVDEMAPDLAALGPTAATGIPDRDALKTAFPDMADAVRQAVLLPADATWWERTTARVEGLVTVRPAPGEVDGNDAAAVLARAEGRLNTGDLAGAVAAIELLNGEAAEAAAAWRRAAQARLSAEAALEHMNSFAIARLSNSEPSRTAQ